jgi:RNA polymerase sigma factor (sigma-70 family)
MTATWPSNAITDGGRSRARSKIQAPSSWCSTGTTVRSRAIPGRRAAPGLTDELASETFLRAFAGRAGYDTTQPDARPWLFGIATNLLRKHARTEARRRRAYARAAEASGTSGGLEGADGRVDAYARAPAVVDALGRLVPADRDTLLLLALTDLGYEGIAIATGVPVGTVRSRLHRARRQVRIALEPELPSTPATTPTERTRT